LNELSRSMLKYPQTLINVRFAENTKPLEDKHVKQAVIEAENALGSRGRVLLRKSGTEPLVRVMVEANDAQDSSTWAEHIADAVRKVTE
jgi:phosphoglucosamine mutase